MACNSLVHHSREETSSLLALLRWSNETYIICYTILPISEGCIAQDSLRTEMVKNDTCLYNSVYHITHRSNDTYLTWYAILPISEGYIAQDREWSNDTCLIRYTTLPTGQMTHTYFGMPYCPHVKVK